MQFHLETDELNLLANILLERVQKLTAQASSDGQVVTNRAERDLKGWNDLTDKVLVRDFRFDSDELQQLADLLADQRRTIDAKIAGAVNVAPKLELQRQRALLERVIEKVNECCVMF